MFRFSLCLKHPTESELLNSSRVKTGNFHEKRGVITCTSISHIVTAFASDRYYGCKHARSTSFTGVPKAQTTRSQVPHVVTLSWHQANQSELNPPSNAERQAMSNHICTCSSNLTTFCVNIQIIRVNKPTPELGVCGSPPPPKTKSRDAVQASTALTAIIDSDTSRLKYDCYAVQAK